MGRPTTQAKRRPCRRCLAAGAALVETSADGLFVWMAKKPLRSPERHTLSLRAGERYEVVRMLREAPPEIRGSS
jgi:hypothetical protein